MKDIIPFQRGLFDRYKFDINTIVTCDDLMLTLKFTKTPLHMANFFVTLCLCSVINTLYAKGRGNWQPYS